MKHRMVFVWFAAGFMATGAVAAGVPAEDCPSCGIVSVSAVGVHGEPVPEGAYFAIAPVGGSLRQPVAEAFEKGTPPSVVWRVAPGTYTSTCVARGFGIAEVLVAPVRSGETINAVCAMTPALTVRGRVLSLETGLPIEGATVTPVAMVEASFATSWSTLAKACLRRSFGAVTDARGLYCAFVPPKSQTAFLIEAAGAAPKLVEGLAVGESPLTLPDAVLPAGGALQVIGTFPPSVDPEQYTAWIFSFSQRGFDKQEEPKLWRRGLGPDGSAGWEGLPPGYWAVRLDTPQGDHLSLGTVHVRPGGVAMLDFSVTASRLSGVLKGIPGELVDTATLHLSPGHTSLTPRLVADAEDRKHNEARFETPLLLPGVYGVVLSLDAENASQVLLGTVATGTNSGEIDRTFELPSRELGGVVLGSDGAPIAGAEVLVCTDDRGLFFESQACATSSNASGSWHCSWLPPGDLLALARMPGAGVSPVESVPAGSSGGGVTLRLAPGATISGKLVVPGVAKVGEAPAGFACEDFPALVVHAKTSEDGEFSLTDLPRCDGQLIVRPTQRDLAFIWRQVSNAPETDMGDLVAERGGAVFAVGSDFRPANAQGLLVKRVLIQHRRACGKLFGFIGGVGTGIPNAPGSAGYFYKLPSGSFSVEWVDEEGKVVARSREIEVRAGEMDEVSFAAR
jgi:hypothetical protein